MMEEIRKYISGCPLFENGLINVNYLDSEPMAYSIESVPASPVIRQYADGGQLRQLLFVLASRELYSKKISDNTKVTKFYEDFAAWLEEQNERGELPCLPPPFSAQSIEVLTSDYMYDLGEMDTRYQIQCRLIYYKEQKG